MIVTEQDSARALRGLVRHIFLARERARQSRYIKTFPTGRDLVGKIQGGTWGTCKWCGEPTDSKRKMWHKHCANVYQAARGLTTGSGNSSLVLFRRLNEQGKVTCWRCGEKGLKYRLYSLEVDHIIPLGLAMLGGPRDWIRAWHPANLRDLCRACHRAKTTDDVRRIRQVQAEQAAGQLRIL